MSIDDVEPQYIEPNLPGEPGRWARPSGSWFGPWPIFHPEWPVPEDGLACVYYLYDHSGICRYVGQTIRLRRRLGEHAKSGKVFAFWVAQWVAAEGALDEAEAVAINMNRLTTEGSDWNQRIPPWSRCWADTEDEIIDLAIRLAGAPHVECPF